MTIEYLTEAGRLRVEHVDPAELRRWTTEHPQVVIVHATPDREDAG